MGKRINYNIFFLFFFCRPRIVKYYNLMTYIADVAWRAKNKMQCIFFCTHELPGVCQNEVRDIYVQ